MFRQSAEGLGDRYDPPVSLAEMTEAAIALLSRNPHGFKEALLLTRDTLGTYLADTWLRLDPDYLHYAAVAEAFEIVDREINGGKYLRLIRGNFAMRDIGYVRVGPQLTPPAESSHIRSVRTLVPLLL